MMPASILKFLTISLSGLFIPAYPAPPEHPSQTRGVPAVSANAPRLVWQKKFVGQENAILGPSNGSALAVFTSARARPVKNYFVPQPLLLTACDLRDGRVQWQQALNADSIVGEEADATRLYATLQLPLASYDPFKLKPDDIRAELAAFDWTNGREIWRTANSSYSGSLLVANGMIFQYRSNGSGLAVTLTAFDARTGHELWQHNGNNNNGLFAVNDLLYAYDESLDDYGPKHDPPGEYLNAYDPLTGRAVQRLRFYDNFRPMSGLGALAWFPQAKRLIGTYELGSPGTQQVEVRAFDAGGKLVWNRPHVGTFQAVGDIMACENSVVQGSRHDYDVSQGLIALDAASGRELWQRRDLDAWELKACGRAFVVRNGSALIGLDARTGKTLWKFALPALSDAQGKSTPPTKQGKMPPPAQYFWRVYGQYLVIAESKAGHAAAVRVYASPN